MTYRPNLSSPIASTTQAGIIKADGITITVAADATASVAGTAVTALTDISSGSLGGPAASDVDTLNRGGTDYKVTLSARSALFRRTPAGSRTITLATGSTSATLTASDNDKQIVVAGTAGSLTADGTITDGFRCLVINKTVGNLAYTGISALGGASMLPMGGAAQIYLAASALEAAANGGNSNLPAATTTTLGGVKPDGVSLSATSDGTLSVVTTTTHALPAGSTVSSADEVAVYSNSSASDVKYAISQIAGYTQSNFQSWTTSARPSPGSVQFVLGYNTTVGRFEFWNGAAWNQHVRVSDLSASSAQLFGGTGASGTATAVTIGSGLQLAGGILASLPATVPVTTVAASGTSLPLSFAASGSRAYDVTLTANCTFTVSGGVAGQFQTLVVIIRGGAGGFSVALPSNVKWKGGGAPSVDTSAGSMFIVKIYTSDGGSTFAGNY